MNTQRLIVLGIAFAAAGGAAFLARGMLGGGTPHASATPETVAMSQVLVAASKLQPGQALVPADVRWQKWPASSVDSSFITHAAAPNLQAALDGTVLRVPVAEGQPLTTNEIVHANATGYMAAMLSPGMRAVSMSITTESGAGGFILPNDRVDIIMTRKDNSGGVVARTVLQNIRVLAVGQTVTQEKNQKTLADAKNATLELTPRQAEIVARAQAEGSLSLALRGLGDSATSAIAANGGSGGDMGVNVIRYGVAQNGSSQGGAAR